MGNPFQKAKREHVWAKFLLSGPSGSGKTYTALRLATGLAEKCGSRIAFIDTEAGRVRYYADEFDFDDMQLEDFQPESYVRLIQAAVDAGYQVLVIDSTSHEWTYCYETVNKMPGNSFTNWGKMTPRHDRFMEAILQSPIHIICTVRGKDEYVLEEKNGKQTPKKVGMGYKQRDDVEYEYTTTLNLQQDTHIATAMKDNTHLFENRFEVLTEKDGAFIYEWANAGAAPAPRKAPAPPAGAEVGGDPMPTTEEFHGLIAAQVDKLVSGGTPREEIGKAVKAAADTANYKKVSDVHVLAKVLKKLKELGGEE